MKKYNFMGKKEKKRDNLNDFFMFIVLKKDNLIGK